MAKQCHICRPKTLANLLANQHKQWTIGIAWYSNLGAHDWVMELLQEVVVANQADKGQDTNLPPIGTREHGGTLTLRAPSPEVAMGPKIQMGETQTGDPIHCSHSLYFSQSKSRLIAITAPGPSISYSDPSTLRH